MGQSGGQIHSIKRSYDMFHWNLEEVFDKSVPVWGDIMRVVNELLQYSINFCTLIRCNVKNSSSTRFGMNSVKWAYLKIVYLRFFLFQ